MSHRPQRKEKNCLNCGTEVIGKYCQNCGQENAEPKETVWHLLQHFFSDLTHFDGKLWHTAWYLITKPGFLSLEYIKGRRASFVNPVSLYFFTSAIFFLVFFSVFQVNDSKIKVSTSLKSLDKLDSSELNDLFKEYNHGQPISTAALKNKIDSFGFELAPGQYKSKEHYDSVLKAGKKDNWITRQITYKKIELNNRLRQDKEATGKIVLEKFEHYLPQMLFVLLPIFALFLNLVYVRRKQFFYVDHAIFTLHLYIFVFIAMIVIFALNSLNNVLHWAVLGYITTFSWLAILFYFYKALRNFYRQRRFKTIIKFMILMFLFIFTTLVLFVVFFLLSLFQI